MTNASDLAVRPVSIGGVAPVPPLGLGGSWFVPYSASGKEDASLLDAVAAAYEGGVRHFDTAGGYGEGRSEELYGAFLEGRRDEVFLASKADPAGTTAEAMTREVEASLRRLRTDRIDLYYIHWPHRDADMRPRMDALERPRRGQDRRRGSKGGSQDRGLCVGMQGPALIPPPV